MTEIGRTMTIDEIVKEFEELLTTRVRDTPAKRDLMRAADYKQVKNDPRVQAYYDKHGVAA
jgi:hypothetical protein